jgi:hypothetical protein
MSCVVSLLLVQNNRLEDETDEKENVLAQLDAVNEDVDVMEEGLSSLSDIEMYSDIDIFLPSIDSARLVSFSLALLALVSCSVRSFKKKR